MARHARELKPPRPRGLGDWLQMLGGFILIAGGALWALSMAGMLIFGFLGLTDFDPMATVQFAGPPMPEGAIVLGLGVVGWMAASGGRHLFFSGLHSRR